MTDQTRRHQVLFPEDATVIGVELIKHDAATMRRRNTVEKSGSLVYRTYQLGICRSVDVTGGPACAEAARTCASTRERAAPVDLEFRCRRTRHTSTRLGSSRINATHGPRPVERGEATPPYVP
jgi:hypothetical protein